MDPLRDTVERALGSQYEVLNLLGRGGMGAVYLARERFLERLVAVKVLPHDAAGDVKGRERFLREAQTAARLSHPSIVPLHTFTEAEGTLLYVMGYVAGESLEAMLAREGRLPAERAARILGEIADALDYAHSMGVVHRDVKPDNILIDGQTGRAFLTDFGIAKNAHSQSLTKTGIAVGTPHYMSPEQASADRDIDGRSDLYSLGVIGYRMVSGRLPFDAPNFQELLIKHVSHEPPPLAVDNRNPGLAPAIMRALRKNPVERWATGADLVGALKPRDESEIDLPDDLADLPARGTVLTGVLAVATAAAGLFAAYTEDYWVMRPLVIGALVTIPMLIGAAVHVGAQHGRGWREILAICFWPTEDWPGWWPRRLRRPGDVWPRLPRSVRVARTWFTAFGFFAAMAFPPMVLTVLWTFEAKLHLARIAERWLMLPSATLMMLTFGVVAILTHPWSRRFGISNSVAARLFAEPTWNRAFWKRPEIAALLGDGPAVATRAGATPAEMVEAIAQLASSLPEPLRVAGRQATGAARDLLLFIGNVDRELAALSREADPAERSRLEQRLASFSAKESGQATARSQMKELVEQQIALFDQLESRRRQLSDDRERTVGLLRSLHLQLANSRAQLAGNALSAATLSAQIRALCGDLEAHRSALREIDAAILPTQDGSGHAAPVLDSPRSG
jgi:predicted Ser/Thr protein kinase